MGLMAWLFPAAEAARREVFARIVAGRAQMDARDKAEAPIRELATDVLPLVYAAELAGARLAKVYVPRERIRLVELAQMESDAIAGIRRDCRVGKILGLRIVEGPELRVE